MRHFHILYLEWGIFLLSPCCHFFSSKRHHAFIVVTSTPNLPKNRGREKLQAILIDAWPKVIYSAIKILGYENWLNSREIYQYHIPSRTLISPTSLFFLGINTCFHEHQKLKSFFGNLVRVSGNTFFNVYRNLIRCNKKTWFIVLQCLKRSSHKSKSIMKDLQSLYTLVLCPLQANLFKSDSPKTRLVCFFYWKRPSISLTSIIMMNKTFDHIFHR